MGYATVMNVPRIADYNEALRRYDNAKPIRGRAPEIRPLGERRDADRYSIRKNVWTNAIEFVLYQTPVIKFTVEDEVKINFGQWSSASTCQFISRILHGVNAYRVRGDVVLGFTDGSKAVIADNEELVLVRKDGKWVPKVAQTLYDYRVSRKGANNVRKQVSQFREYLAGVVKLKAEEFDGVYGRAPFSVVKIGYPELIEVFGKEIGVVGSNGSEARVRPAVDEWKCLNSKEYRDKAEKFYELVKNDQDDNCRYQNYWIAFHVLFAADNHFVWTAQDEVPSRYCTCAPEEFEKHLDRILFTMFSDKVFKKVALPTGKVPTGKYDNYVRSEG
jgi:hypothetical protein